MFGLNCHSARLMKQLQLLTQQSIFYQAKFNGLRTPQINEQIRSYLSSAYEVKEKWQSRLNDPYVKEIITGDYYYDLISNYKKTKKVAAVDADIFVQSISKLDEYSNQLEETIRVLRRSPETIHTMPSMLNAFVRLCYESEKTDFFLRILTEPLSYGIFLDYFSANLMMDKFIKMENYTAASRIAYSLMTQEDFGPPLTRSFCLLSCLKYVLNEAENPEWTDYNPTVEPEEEIKIRVPYIRNPYFDDHFDIKEPTAAVGKTLAWLSMHLGDAPAPLQQTASALGWAMFQKWDKLELSLGQIADQGVALEEAILENISQNVESCDNEECKGRLQSAIEKIRKKNLVSKTSIVEQVENYLKQEFEKCEQSDIKEQEALFDEYTKRRDESVKLHLKEMERTKLIKEIEEKKTQLKYKEDVIFFFDKEDQYELLISKDLEKQELIEQQTTIEQKKKVEKLRRLKDEEEYIVPEMPVNLKKK